MLGKTAGGLYWMSRLLERSENTARLIEAGFRIALTRSKNPQEEWKSVLTTAGILEGYDAKYDRYSALDAVDFLLRDSENPSSVISSLENARTNARLVRTALTTEVWEAVNESWMVLKVALKKPINETQLPALLGEVRRHTALVRGAVHGTMLRNDIFDFTQIGTALERADNTARIIDVKYYTLLPSANSVGSTLDNVQWETVLRSVSAHSSFKWLNNHEVSPSSIAEFLILDSRFPRSLSFCSRLLGDNLGFLAKDYDMRMACHDLIETQLEKMHGLTIDRIFDEGLHAFITSFIRDNNAIGLQIEKDYRFLG